MSSYTLRIAEPRDIPAIHSIHTYYLLHSTCMYQTEPEPLSAREAWFASHIPSLPITVVEHDGEVIAWGSLSHLHSRSVYRFTAENSIYVRHDRRRHGIGSIILQDQIERARSLGYRSIIASIDSEQTASLALHCKFGFEQVGHLHQVGNKFNRWLDVIYMQRML